MPWQELVPPILISLWKKRQATPTAERLYSSYAEAFAACHGGYEDPRLIRTVYEKTRLYRDRLASQTPRVFDLSTLRTLVGVSLAVTEEALNVIDFGGACGAHYFIARAFMGDRVRFRWHIIETSKMAAMAKGLEDGQLKFFDSLRRAKEAFEKIDLVFSSGALQYVPDPYATLGELTQCGATALFLTRIGLTRHPSELITIQTSLLSENGPGALPEGMPDGTVKSPITFVRKDKVEDIINENYSLDTRFDEDKQAYIAGNIGIDMYGYFATLRTDCP
jgi:putative methyltransferase (TIGR04325 family)